MSADSLDLFAATPYTPHATPDDVQRFVPTADEPLPRGVTMLEASAGTGKTYSIASLVLRLVIEERLGIDEILVVTFTEAATAELRDRIRRRLRDALALAEQAREAGVVGGHAADVAHVLLARAASRGLLDDATDALRDALARFDDAAIATIHGFCLRVLRDRAFECGGELDAELLTDDTELVDAVVRDFWAKETASRPVALVDALVGRGKLGLERLRLLARRALRHPDADCAPALHELDEAPLEARVRERARLATDLAGRWNEEDASHAIEMVEAAREAKALNGNKWRADAVEKRARAVSLWIGGDPAADLLPEQLTPFGTSALRAATNKGRETPSHGLYDLVDALVEADGAVSACAMTEALRLQHDCVAFTRREVARRKQAARQHGFDDLLRLVRDALRRDADHPTTPFALAHGLRESFRAALIDEFQDTDDVQWEIFRRAFGTPEHRLVLIGDPKQSIYAFRGADVDAYLAARGLAATRWALDTNWRTDRALVDALHALWGAHPQPFLQREIGWRRITAQHDEARLADGGAPLRVRLLEREGPLTPTGKSRHITKEKLHARLPDLVARDVARFLSSDATIAERVGQQVQRRSVRPADVAVLVRSHRQARAVQAALRRAGVPAVIHGAESIFASREATELIAVLAAVLESASLSLARSALATDLLGVAAAVEMGEPDVVRGPGDVLARLDADDARWDPWIERLRSWRAAWRGDGPGRRGAPSVMRLVRAMCDDLQLPARLLALVDGERRLTNLLHLGEILHTAASEQGLAPGATLAWLREQVANSESGRGDAARQLRLESDDEAAQVVTVHSSKGLEYGAVWCPYLWDGAGTQAADLCFPCVAMADGDARRAIDLLGSAQTPSGARVEAARFAESMRLAYVAMTRARHQVTLWWGAATHFSTSPLAWLLHGRPADDVSSARAALHGDVDGLADHQLRARLEQLCAGARDLVTVEVEDVEAAPVRWQSATDARPPLSARPWTRTQSLDDGWRVGSFTGLTRGAHTGHDADDTADTDDGVAPEALADARRDAADDGEGDVPLAAFPASAQAGLCFHEILERHDPAAPEGLRTLVDGRLQAYGFDAPRWGATVVDAVGADARRAVDRPARRSTPARHPTCGSTGGAALRAARLRRGRHRGVAGGAGARVRGASRRRAAGRDARAVRRAGRGAGLPSAARLPRGGDRPGRATPRSLVARGLQVQPPGRPARGLRARARAARDDGRALRAPVSSVRARAAPLARAARLRLRLGSRRRWRGVRVPARPGRRYGDVRRSAAARAHRGAGPSLPGGRMSAERDRLDLFDAVVQPTDVGALDRRSGSRVPAHHAVPTLDALRACGVLRDIDVHFARTAGRLADVVDPLVTLGLAVASRAPGAGHVCAELDAPTRLVRLEAAADVAWPDADAWCAALAASPVVASAREAADATLCPLVLDGRRLYLARYWAYQRRLLGALDARAATLRARRRRDAADRGARTALPDGAGRGPRPAARGGRRRGAARPRRRDGRPRHRQDDDRARRPRAARRAGARAGLRAAAHRARRADGQGRGAHGRRDRVGPAAPRARRRRRGLHPPRGDDAAPPARLAAPHADALPPLRRAAARVRRRRRGRELDGRPRADGQAARRGAGRRAPRAARRPRPARERRGGDDPRGRLRRRRRAAHADLRGAARDRLRRARARRAGGLRRGRAADRGLRRAAAREPPLPRRRRHRRARARDQRRRCRPRARGAARRRVGAGRVDAVRGDAGPRARVARRRCARWRCAATATRCAWTARRPRCSSLDALPPARRAPRGRARRRWAQRRDRRRARARGHGAARRDDRALVARPADHDRRERPRAASCSTATSASCCARRAVRRARGSATRTAACAASRRRDCPRTRPCSR